MTALVFAVFDKKTAAYMQPIFQMSRGQALRSFMDTVEQKDSLFCKHPGDFALYELGTYDDESGKLASWDPPVFVCEAADLLQKGV